MKRKIDIYINKNLFKSTESSRKTLPRSVFLEKIIDENINTVEPDDDSVHTCVYINPELYKKILEKTQGRRVSSYLEKLIKMGVKGNV